MNTREAMRALLDGKRIIRDDMKSDGYAFLQLKNGRLVWENGNPATLVDARYDLYIELNLHPKGTFNWAREEAKRGRLVHRPRKLRACDKGDFERFAVHSIESFDATDWEIYE